MDAEIGHVSDCAQIAAIVHTHFTPYMDKVLKTGEAVKLLQKLRG